MLRRQDVLLDGPRLNQLVKLGIVCGRVPLAAFGKDLVDERFANGNSCRVVKADVVVGLLQHKVADTADEGTPFDEIGDNITRNG